MPQNTHFSNVTKCFPIAKNNIMKKKEEINIYNRVKVFGDGILCVVMSRELKRHKRIIGLMNSSSR